jgi:predicted ATPase
MASGTLIGRDRELDEIAERLQHHRLVTVVGPGGVGKTTLALSAAERVAHRFPLGVHVVDLTRIDHAGAVPGAVAAQLGFDSFESLLSSPADQPALLLLDNCEHLLDPVASCAVQVLGACLQPCVLATSRSPLELPGESVLAIAPLPVPRTEDAPGSFASVQLFLERVRDAGVDPAGVDPEVVGELCRRLDGLPLALEIAAARTRTLGLADIVRGLDEGASVLDRPRFRGAPRHRSITDTIQWSHGLLTSDAASLLARLSVFAGPFSMASARAVAPLDDLASDQCLDELVHASLVSVDTLDGAARYRLFDTVRRFAADRLRESGEQHEAYDRFADHVVGSLRNALSGAMSSWRPALVSDLVDAFDDIAEALRWCVQHDESPRRTFALCGALWAIVHQGHADDAAELARSALARWPDIGTQSGAIAVASLATAEYTTGHPDVALQLAEASLARLSSVGPATVTLHRVIGQSRRALHDTAGAAAAFRAGAAVGHDLGLTAMALELDIAAAIVRADLGAVDDGVDELRSIIDRAVEVDSTLSGAWARSALGWLLLRVDPAGALEVIDQALAESRSLDYPIGIAVGLRSRAYAELLDGDAAAAVGTAGDLLDELLGRRALSNLRLLLDVVAVLAHRAGHPDGPCIAATARSSPITTLVCAHHELVALPTVSAAPTTPRDAIRRVRQVLADLAEPTFGEAAARGAETAPARRVRRLGDVVEFTFDGRTVSLRSSKGIADIVTLIEAAGRDVHCVELAGVTVEQSSTGEIIDRAARQQYEQRIRDLQAEIDEAEANSDYARSYRYQTELDTLIDHLTAALGHGKRNRRAADSAERARSAVTHRVRAALRQIAGSHPALGSHLTHAISTGVYCAYRPEHPVPWTVD